MASSDLFARLTLLDMLWRRGFPATMATPAGLLPAIFVWVDTPEDPVLRMLPRAFGGHLWLEMRDHHGEESPAFWVGAGRSAVLALGVLLGALEAADRLVGAMADAGSDSGWPPRSELLGDAAERAWRQLEAFASTRFRPEPGAADREAVAGEGGALEAWVAAAFELAPHISGSLNTAMLSMLRAENSAVDLALPTRRERNAWAAAFLAPLLRGGASKA